MAVLGTGGGVVVLLHVQSAVTPVGLLKLCNTSIVQIWQVRCWLGVLIAINTELCQ